jgi:RNA polymerase sigma factor (sigma-70 family)
MASTPQGFVLQHLRTWLIEPGGAPVPDHELLARFVRRRDEAAFAALVRRHGGMVLGVCRSVLRSGPDVEDVFQSTFLLLATRAGSIRNPGSVGSFLHGVAYRLALKQRAAAKLRRHHEGRARRAPPCPRDEITWGDLQQILHAELECLPEKYRTPLVLCYLEGQTQDEAAGLLGWPKGTLKGRLERGRRLLRTRLLRRGLGPTAMLSAAVLSPEPAQAVAAPLLHATVKAAAASGLREKGTHLFFQLALTRSKIALAVIIAGILGTGVGLLAYQGTTPQPAAVQRDGSQAEKQARTDSLGDPLPPGAVLRLGSLRFRPGGDIYHLSYLPGGGVLASTGFKGIRFFDAATGKELRRIAAPGDGTWCFVVSADGKRVAAGCYDKTIRIWETATGTEVRTIKATATHLAFSHDERCLLSEYDSTLRLWDWRTGKEELRILNRGQIDAVAFSADDRKIHSLNGTSMLSWDVESGRQVGRFEQKDPRVFSTYLDGMILSPDGKLLAASRWQQPIRLHEAASGRELRRFDAGATKVQTFSPDGKVLVLAGEGRLSLRDVTSGAEVCRIPERGAAAFSPDGKTVAVGGWNGAVTLYDSRTGQRLGRQIGHAGQADRLAFSPDGRLLASRSFTDQTVRIWDARSGRPLHVLGGRDNHGYTLAFSPDGRRVVWGDWEGRVHLADPQTDEEVAGWQVDKEIKTIDALAFTPDGRTLATVSYQAMRPGQARPTLLQTWDVAGHKELSRRQQPLGRLAGSGVTFGPGGRVIVLRETFYQAEYLTPSLVLRDVSRGRELVKLSGIGRHDVLCFAFSPDSAVVAAVTSENVTRGPSSNWENYKVRLWETASGEELLVIPVKTTLGGALAFSPNGRLIAAADSDTIHLWDAATGEGVLRFQGHESRVHSLCFAPDGATLASGLADSTVLIWDLASHKLAPRPAAVRDVDQLWADLAGPGPKAQRAVWSLAAMPQKSVGMLRERLRPAPQEQADRIRRWIADLDSGEFDVRQRAVRELERAAADAEPALLRALAAGPSPEARKRIEALLEMPRTIRSPDALRQFRAIRVLESIASPEARRLLQTLAGGADAPMTWEARAALERLARRLGGSP